MQDARFPATLDEWHAAYAGGLSVREAMEIFMRLGLEPVVMGQGHIVSAQKPAAGARIDSKGNVECVLWLSEQE